MLRLIDLKDNYGARYKYKRVGRGIGSGKGKTSGSGGKGQTARSGVALKGFEGGQTPLYIRLPRRGFKSLNKKVYTILIIGQIINGINLGYFTRDKKITIQSLFDANLVKSIDEKVKLLADPTDADITLNLHFHIEVHAVSYNALRLIESYNGTVSIIEKIKVEKQFL